MPLTQNQRKHLRRLGHPLQPVVLIGQAGLTDAVVRETSLALDAHELLKVRARVGDRQLREQVLSTLAERTDAELVQTIGNVGLFYKKNKELPKILIPDS
jgi:RNA-binding protein